MFESDEDDNFFDDNLDDLVSTPSTQTSDGVKPHSTDVGASHDGRQERPAMPSSVTSFGAARSNDDGHAVREVSKISHTDTRCNPKTTLSRQEARFRDGPDDGVVRGRRKFPGPAGILPRIAAQETSFLNKLDKPVSGELPVDDGAIEKGNDSEGQRKRLSYGDTEKVINKQSLLAKHFENSESWQQVMRHAGFSESDPECLVHKYNVAWINQKTSPGPSKRCPVLVCIVAEIDFNACDPRCVLIDRSGSVEATLHRTLMERISTYIHPGSVVMLKDVHVIMTARKHCIIVTERNLVTISHPKSSGGVLTKNFICVTKDDLRQNAERAESYMKEMMARIRRNRARRQQESRNDSESTMPPEFRPMIVSTPVSRK